MSRSTKVIFVLFPYKKYSRCFITLWLNHWWQMDYFGDAFLGLDSVIYLAVNGTVTSLLVFIQSIFNCVLKTNEAFTGLEGHGLVINDKIFILGWSIPLKLLCIPQHKCVSAALWIGFKRKLFDKHLYCYLGELLVVRWNVLWTRAVMCMSHDTQNE